MTGLSGLEPPIITPAQLRLLALLLRKHIDDGRDDAARNARHAWIAWMLDRGIGSTRDLTRDEASRLIDALASEDAS